MTGAPRPAVPTGAGPGLGAGGTTRQPGFCLGAPAGWRVARCGPKGQWVRASARERHTAGMARRSWPVTSGRTLHPHLRTSREASPGSCRSRAPCWTCRPDATLDVASSPSLCTSNPGVTPESRGAFQRPQGQEPSFGCLQLWRTHYLTVSCSSAWLKIPPPPPCLPQMAACGPQPRPPFWVPPSVCTSPSSVRLVLSHPRPSFLPSPSPSHSLHSRIHQRAPAKSGGGHPPPHPSWPRSGAESPLASVHACWDPQAPCSPWRVRGPSSGPSVPLSRAPQGGSASPTALLPENGLAICCSCHNQVPQTG